MADEYPLDDFIKLRRLSSGNYTWEISIRGQMNEDINVEDIVKIDKELLKKFPDKEEKK